MTIDRVLKRCFPAFTLLLIAVVAYLQARGATRLLALALAGSARISALPPKPEARPPAPTTATDAPGLEPTRLGFVEVPRAGSGRPLEGSTSDARIAEPLSWPSCPDVRVVIVTESADPSWSLATLRAPSEPLARVRRVGDRVSDRQVAYIGYNPRARVPAVWLQGRDSQCQALLLPAEPAPLPVAVAKGHPAVSEPPSLGASGTLRVVPEKKDGEIVGVRLFGIRPSSVLGALGLRNGDRLESINGFELTTPAKALEAYARLRTAERLHVRLDRSGRTLELDFNFI